MSTQLAKDSAKEYYHLTDTLMGLTNTAEPSSKMDINSIKQKYMLNDEAAKSIKDIADQYYTKVPTVSLPEHTYAMRDAIEFGNPMYTSKPNLAYNTALNAAASLYTGKDENGKSLNNLEYLDKMNELGLTKFSYVHPTQLMDVEGGRTAANISFTDAPIPDALLTPVYTKISGIPIYGINNIIPDTTIRNTLNSVLNSGTSLTTEQTKLALEKAKQGLSSTDINDILQKQADAKAAEDLAAQTTPSTADVTSSDYVNPTTGTTGTTGTTTDTTSTTTGTTTGINYSQALRNDIEKLGLTGVFSDADINDLASRWKRGETSQYELNSFFKGTPEYQQKQAEIQQQKATEEGNAARQQLGTELEKQSTKYLQDQAVPALEQVYGRVGGTNRASLNTAAARAMRDVTQARESQLATSGIEQAAQQSAYNRQDYLSLMQQEYNNYLSQYNTMNQVNMQNRDLTIQQTLRPQQLADLRMQNLYNERQSSLQRDWQTQMLNLQRQWQIEDRDYAQSQADKQGLLGFLGNVAKVGTGALLGAVLPGVTAGQGALLGFTSGMYNPWFRQNRII